jgi:hypothetical protein
MSDLQELAQGGAGGLQHFRLHLIVISIKNVILMDLNNLGITLPVII